MSLSLVSLSLVSLSLVSLSLGGSLSLVGSLSLLRSLSLVGRRLRLAHQSLAPPDTSSLSRAVELGIERISLESEGLWRDPEPCLSLADYNCGPLPG